MGTRPNTLPVALAAAEALAERYPGGAHLLREDTSWWQHARWQEYGARFREVHAFHRVKMCRGPLDVFRLRREYAERQRRLEALPFDRKQDALICLSGVTMLANAAASAYRGALRVLCLPRVTYDTLVQPPDRWRYRFTTASWLQNRLVEPLAGVERTLHLKPRFNRGGDGVRLVRLQREPEGIYDAVIVMSNTGRERPGGAGSRTLSARFPDLSEPRAAGAEDGGEGTAQARRRVVFFGTPFLLVKNLPPGLYAERLNDCLDYLRRFYPGCDLVYRPHPAEAGEASCLRLDGFQIETDGEVAELYFLRNFRRIEAVFSVSSTVSRVALNSGLDAYCLWRCFSFAEKQRQFFAQVMGTVPPEFEVSDLAVPPVAYVERRRENESAGLGPSLGEALRKAVG